MYIGDPDARGLDYCVFELIANSLVEYVTGRGSRITVTIHEDGSLSVKDEGGGISIVEDPIHKIPFVQSALTSSYVNRNRTDYSPYGAGLHGVGAKCVNALSEWMKVTTVWEGAEYQITFARGRVNEPLMKVRDLAGARGTTVRFKPDPTIFSVTTFDRNTLAVRLEHLAVLHPGLEFWLLDERPNSATRPLVSRFHYPGGIADFLAVAGPDLLRPHPGVAAFQGEVDGIKIVLGFQFMDSKNSSVLGFVNSILTRREGTHVQGFLQGMADAFAELAGQEQLLQPNDLRVGLKAVVAVWLAAPRFGGATKDELINPEVEAVLREFTAGRVRRWIAESGDRAEWLMVCLNRDCRAESD